MGARRVALKSGGGAVFRSFRSLPAPSPHPTAPAMDVAARPSGHKRGLSAYDSQLASFDPSGKVARPSEAEAPEGDAEQQEQQHEEQPLTESAAFHLRTLRDMQANVVEQIDNLQGERSRLGRRQSRGGGAAAGGAAPPAAAVFGQQASRSLRCCSSGRAELCTASGHAPTKPRHSSLPACTINHRASAFPPSSRRPPDLARSGGPDVPGPNARRVPGADQHSEWHCGP